ncbi:CopD family protein [Shewanella eurypsychrophilus]|uniref:Copper resistance protein D n=1 Tax=Shewanella eurypsychrophilus TaxID=2593656 RepID=A0ABX6V5H4_9GAMM|nr:MULTISPECIES: CopD family protein [Shewanella]QFU22596.1 copper resistance protein CopD [Shewanella sp. YLB-09]QPG57885.1 CopD family protein [Shewanella eurypsychrophilus]
MIMPAILMTDVFYGLSLFDILGIMTKWLIYIGVTTSLGGFLMTLMNARSITRKRQIDTSTRSAVDDLSGYMRKGAMIGILAVVMNFFIQVGSFAETGLAGMWDPLMTEILWQSSVGGSISWRIAGFVLVLLATLMPVKRTGFVKKSALGLLLMATLCLAYSFTLIGHSADMDDLGKCLVAIHVVAIGAWIGSLIPLWIMCGRLEAQSLKGGMDLFGKQAIFIVAVVVITGLILLSLLFNSPSEFIDTGYGRAILTKLFIISMILAIAALHKFHLVPKLDGKAQESGSLAVTGDEANSAGILKRSIGVEILIAALILTTTAVLSSVLGPQNLA